MRCAIEAAVVEAALAFFARHGDASEAGEALRLELLDRSTGAIFAT